MTIPQMDPVSNFWGEVNNIIKPLDVRTSATLVSRNDDQVYIEATFELPVPHPDGSKSQITIGIGKPDIKTAGTFFKDRLRKEIEERGLNPIQVKQSVEDVKKASAETIFRDQMSKLWLEVENIIKPLNVQKSESNAITNEEKVYIEATFEFPQRQADGMKSQIVIGIEKSDIETAGTIFKDRLLEEIKARGLS